MTMDSGLYIAVFHLPSNRDIQVGRLGIFSFARGHYFYVGSAQRNLSARIERHRRRSKPLRWHIDYLSAQAEMLGAIVISGSRQEECRLARELGQMYQLAAPAFGSSDCRCGGHLFFESDDNW